MARCAQSAAVTAHNAAEFGAFRYARRRRRTVGGGLRLGVFAAIASTAVRLLDGWEKGSGLRTWVHREKFKAEMIAAFVSKRIPDLRPLLPHIPDTYDPSDTRTDAEAVENLFFFNCMGEDEPSGTFTLDDDDLDLRWPKDQPPGKQRVFADIEELIREFCDAMGGRYVPLPMWRGLGDGKLAITHPLGGCRIGDSREDGVVNAVGQVYDAAADDPTAVHQGFHVVDASVIPGAVVAHPSMTIVAQALKTMAATTPSGTPEVTHA